MDSSSLQNLIFAANGAKVCACLRFERELSEEGKTPFKAVVVAYVVNKTAESFLLRMRGVLLDDRVDFL